MAMSRPDPARLDAPIRVLQFVADTDPDPATDAALALHRRLVDHGLEVRTLALTPGNRPGHESLLPVIAPTRRSLAARSGVQVERRWADVVVLHGQRVLVHATLPPRSSPVPTVYAGPGPVGGAGTVPGGRTAERFTRRLAAVVTTTLVGTGPTPVPNDAHSDGDPAVGAVPTGQHQPEVLSIPIDAAAGAEWAALLRQLVAGCPPRRGG